MEKVILELNKGIKEEMEFLTELKKVSEIETIEPERLTGAIDIIITTASLTSVTIELISRYYALKKAKGTKVIRIKNKRISLENFSKEEIKNLLEKKII